MEDKKHIRDLFEEGWNIVSNEDEIYDILEIIGELNDETEKPGCLFVKMKDGEYEEIYACDRTIPFLGAPVNKIYPKE